ncbi:hypothetical protein ARMGADRAFT_481480 [Armillaria gallica]|nr:hypothetical protein ARMGADRAFT_481480 [Armillaria gallica]
MLGERDAEIQACVEGWFAICRKDRNGNTRRFRERVSIRTSKSLVFFPPGDCACLKETLKERTVVLRAYVIYSQQGGLNSAPTK